MVIRLSGEGNISSSVVPIADDNLYRAAGLSLSGQGYPRQKLMSVDDVITCNFFSKNRYRRGRCVGRRRRIRCRLNRCDRARIVHLADDRIRGVASAVHAVDCTVSANHAELRLAASRCRRYDHYGVVVGIHNICRRGHVVGVTGNRYGSFRDNHLRGNRGIGLTAYVGRLGHRSGLVRRDVGRRRRGRVVVGRHKLAGHFGTRRIVFHALGDGNRLHQRDISCIGFRRTKHLIVRNRRHAVFGNGRNNIGGGLASPFRLFLFRPRGLQLIQLGGYVGIGIKRVGRVDQVSLGVGFVPPVHLVMLSRG